MTQHKVQCFWAEQETHYDMEKTVSVKTESDTVKVAVITNENKIVTDDSLANPIDTEDVQLDDDGLSLAQIDAQSQQQQLSMAQLQAQNEERLKQMQRLRQSTKRFNAHMEHVPSDETDAAISFINSQDFGWKADVCKLQKHHSDYGAHCDQQEQVLAQVSSFSDKDEVKLTEAKSTSVANATSTAASKETTDDSKKHSKKEAKKESKEEKKEKKKPVFGDDSKEFKKALEKVQSWAKKYKTAEEIPDDELPQTYDFTNIDGFDFTGPVRDQGACGSCYTVSFAQVVESRLKMKYGQEVPMLSSQYLMTCNYMNEGCDGGWSFFHGYLAENGHMVDEQCAPYLGKTKGEQCGQYAKCKPISRVQESYFIGGAYGQSSEERMMKEILRNGIVNGELNVPRVFSFYQQGILSNDHESKMSSYLEYSGVASHHKEAQQMIGSEAQK